MVGAGVGVVAVAALKGTGLAQVRLASEGNDTSIALGHGLRAPSSSGVRNGLLGSAPKYG